MKYRVWHMPQFPGKMFRVPVTSIEEAVKVMDLLADYDIFQFKHKIKPDYSNMQGLERWDFGAWLDWYDPETGEDDPRKYLESINKKQLEKS